MINFLKMEEEKLIKETEKCLDPEFWNACAGTMVKMPCVNSKVFYFPQGHAEHASGNVDFRNLPSIPPLIPCKISRIKYMADPDTDEVFSKIKLIPLNFNVYQYLYNGFSDQDDDDDEREDDNDNDRPKFFAKTLTQSDANNGGGFSVPRYCAETIFPKLNFSVNPPVQTILAKDVHGEIWKFRHIYRGTPRRHLLTTGWSTFVNQKKLMAGDSIVFLRTDDGELCVGIRRNKRGIGFVESESSSGWIPAGGMFSTYFRDENANGWRGKVKAESVIEAANLAISGEAFEVVYYPRASTPEFCVKASRVKAALRIQWCSGLRFKMAFETEDSSRTSWFMGTISSVHPVDPTRWPNSPWRHLEVTWDELDLLQNVKNVSSWLIELVSNIPVIPFTNPRKKLRLTSTNEDQDHYHPSSFSLPFNCLLQDNAPDGMQGARATSYGLSSLSDHYHFHSKFQKISNFYPYPNPNPPANFHHPFLNVSINPPPKSNHESLALSNPSNTEKVSCMLTIGNPTPTRTSSTKPAQIVLFGKPILTGQQLPIKTTKKDGLESGFCCKVYMKSKSELEDLGRNLDLSLFVSYEELYRELEIMFGMKSSKIIDHVLYNDIAGSVKRIGDQSFSEFVKTAKQLTIETD